MLELALPWALLLLPAPLLAWRYLPPRAERREALRVPFFARLASLEQLEPRRGAVARRRGVARTLLLSAMWIALVLALARPTLRGAPVTVTRSARDLLLAVDLSRSMEVRDLDSIGGGQAPTRLEIVKEVVADFVVRREGDRLGLIVFGAAPYVQVPFTLDTQLLATLLGEAEPGMAGDSTALGDAIGLALRSFERSEASTRVLVLLTDGNDTGSEVPPLSAARVAAQRGITVHVIGVGDPELAGEERLNEEVLAAIAADTKGRYFHASDRTELAEIYAQLDRLEPVEFESRTFTPEREVFHYPLGVAGLLLLAFSLVALVPLLTRARAARG